MLIDVPRLVSEYYVNKPDYDNAVERVSFGTSGHRGSSKDNRFNEHHVVAICKALIEYRQNQKIDGPLFVGKDTHALSEPALFTTVEVLAAYGVELRLQRERGFTPTPVISHAILNHNRTRSSQADGVVITPSHNPPGDGGFKYNPPTGGPADAGITQWIQDRANEILQKELDQVNLRNTCRMAQYLLLDGI